MQCYFNLISSHKTILDEEGIEVADMKEARFCPWGDRRNGSGRCCRDRPLARVGDRDARCLWSRAVHDRL